MRSRRFPDWVARVRHAFSTKTRFCKVPGFGPTAPVASVGGAAKVDWELIGNISTETSIHYLQHT